MARKKKSHGGLKFLAFLFVVGALITSGVMTSKTEFGQRVLGQRQDRRLERTAVPPRFAYAAATLRITIGTIYNNDGTPVDLTETRDVSIDRESATTSSKVNIERTSTEVEPGVSSIPFDALNFDFTEVLTKGFRYESDQDPAYPWTRTPVEPYYYGSELDDHYIPMVQDVMGFELRDLSAQPAVAKPESGLRATLRPAVTGPTPPPAVTESYTFETDLGTLRRAAPILFERTAMNVSLDSQVTVTIGFDDVGLLRFADISVASSLATTLAQQLGAERSAVYHYSLEVTEISGEPIDIDVPTNVVDAPLETVPVETTPVVTP
ncbi:MAG: hypothetical protein M3P52_03340 [Actinomycetota bacterium]|nr:hypothetical protein [Actinomycetota bacterium]